MPTSRPSRYAHVDRDELFDAACWLEQLAAPKEESTVQVEPDQPSASGDRSDDGSSQAERPRRRRRRRRGRR
jgi:hypothetical protein